MPKQNIFSAEYAKSSMATCRVCMAKIPKEALRIGHLQVDTTLPNDMPVALSDAPIKEPTADDKRLQAIASATRWHHFECFPRMKGAKWMTTNLPPNPRTLLGFEQVKKADQKKIIEMWKAIWGGGSKRSSAGVSHKRKAGNAADSSTAKRQRKDTSSASKLAKLTSVQGVLSASVFKKMQKVEEELSSSSGAQLQAELAKNDQVRSGKVQELVQRVAEGRVLGALPSCPRCTTGRIHWSRVGGWYSCPGYYDKETNAQRRCYFRTQELKRKKWRKA